MQTKLPILILLVLFLQLSYSQDKKYGLVGGFNYSTLNGDFEDIIPSERRLSYHLGFFRDFTISDKIKIEPQLVYTSRGFRNKFSETTFPIIEFINGNPVRGTTVIGSEGAYVLNYLDIPVQLKYALKSNIDLILGPQIGYLLNAKFKGSSTVDGETEEDTSKLDFDNRLDFGGLIGVSYGPGQSVSLALKYYQGFYDINRKEDIIIGGGEPVRMTSSVFQLSLGYFLF